ncbi:hypothetical protein OUZ56_007894 [Daphnia magna]|uniref:Pre-mRNA 3' end processing protein WDR33 n=1 Tax=Daphnia magna TaxID=35525 RepID=A0ABR0ABA3_9CRUS|nr:hypothetical protein OUZ56_007894 [Daphnia magna]
MATQMAYYPGANGMSQSPFQSRHATGPSQSPANAGNNSFLGAGLPRIVPGGDPLRPPIPPGRHMFHPFNRPYPKPGQDRSDYDSKQLRKSSMRKTVDYYSSVIRMLETRVWQRDARDRRSLQPDVCYYPEMLPPSCYLDMPSDAITTRFTKVATNKIRCPVFCLTWTPEGRRLITGASSGEFTLWNGLTFNFETILQAHDSPVRSMVWSHNDIWMVTGDHGGYIKYWQSNMNNVKMFQAHKEAIRGISFSPTDQKLASCSDDGTVRIWDFVRCQEEKILRGHGADVKCVDWHPQKGLVISGSKDNQQPVKLWDPKSGQSLATLHAHKSTVMDAKWNKNGQWLITASRDHLIKLFDIRRLDQELQTFRGHKKEASCLSWHPFHEELFCSGGSDGAIFFWNVGTDKEVGAIDQAHESLIWSLAWHPIGHILCSGSNDHTSKFWTRNRPGDKMRDKYNLNTLPPGVMPEDAELLDDHHAPNIPGMGPDDKIETDGGDGQLSQSSLSLLSAGMIPGLDVEPLAQDVKPIKKVPYAKPIPRHFQAQWNDSNASKKPAILPTPNVLSTSVGQSDDEDYVLGVDPVAFGMEQLGRATLTLFGMPANDAEKMQELLDTVQSQPAAQLPVPTAIIIDGTILSIEADSELDKAIRTGEEELNEVLFSMGLKLTIEEEESKPVTVPNDDYNQDRELDDDDFYPRSRTPVLDDSPGYARGHSGIGPTPTGGLLGDFPREFQQRGHPVQPIRHPLPPGVGQQHHHHQQQHQQHHHHHNHHGGWQGQPPPQEMANWDRPPFDPAQQPQDRFPPRPPHGQGPMNRPYFQPPHHQDRFNQSGPPLPPPGRGRGHHGPGGNAWGGPPPMDNEEEMHYMGNGGPPMPPVEDDMRMEGGYAPPPPPQMNERHGDGNFGWGPGPNNYRGGNVGGVEPPGPYDRNDEEYGSRGPPGPPGHFAPNYPGQFHPPPPHHQPPSGRWNPDGGGGGRGGYGRGGGGRRPRRGGYNNY